VDNPEQKLFPGMTADVSILVVERDNALKLPNAALRYTPPETATFEQAPPAKLDRRQRLVYAMGTNGAKLRPTILKVGISDGVDTEIVEGPAEGTMIVTATLSGAAKASGFGGGPPTTP
jgi:HlyD family secretion protein